MPSHPTDPADGRTSDPPIDVHAVLAAFASDLARSAGRRLVATALLMLLCGLLEGFGLLLLVPLLAAIGFGTGADSPIADSVTRSFEGLGLSPGLAPLLGLFIALVTVRLLVTRMRDEHASALRLGFTDHLRCRLFDRIARASWQFLRTTRSAHLTHALTTEAGRIGQGTHHALSLCTTAVLALAHVVAALALAPLFAALALGLGLALLLPLTHLNRRSVALGARMTATQQGLQAQIGELLAGLREHKMFGAEARCVEAFDAQALAQRETQLEFVRVGAAARLQFQLSAALSMALLAWLGIRHFALPPESLLALLVIVARLAPQLSALQQGAQQLLHMLPAYASLRRLEDACARAAEPAPGAHGLAPLALGSGLRLEDIAFAHGGDDTAALSAIDLHIPPQQTVALVGHSGSGKSTLADLLAGLLEPTRGRLLLDGQPMDASARVAWRGSVAYVPQETFLLHASIRDNLRWATAEADDAALTRALEQAAAGELVASLPDGLDTIVGERGMRLSGGERQRIALARALLGNPSLLILDEATSALDHANEQAIQAALEAIHGRLAVILIAHRLSTVRHADRVVVMDGGRIVEQGAWAVLAGRPDGHFARLLREQGIAS